MNVLDSLLIALGYEFDDEGLTDFEKSLDTVTEGINKVTLAGAAMIATFVGATVASAGTTDSLTKQALRADILVGELDAYNFAAEQAMGTSDGMAGALRQLAIRSSEAARGTGSAVEAFGILGISVTDADGRIKSVNEILGESADKLNALEDNSQRLELADKLGLGELDLLLRQGSIGINALTAEARALGVATAEDSKAAEEFNDQFNRVKRVLTATVRFVATSVLPTFTELAKKVQTWVQQNKELIRSRLLQFLNAITFALRNFQLIVGLILSLKFAVFILRLVAAYKALGAAALLANVKMFFIVIAIAAVIAAMGLLIEDFIVFQRGGESAIGALLEKFPLLDAVIRKVGEAFQQARLWVGDFFEAFFEALPKAQAILTDFFEAFFDWLKRARAITTLLFESIDNAIGSTVAAFGGAQKAVTSFLDKVSATFLKVKSIFDSVKGFLGKEVRATINTVSGLIQQQPALSFAGGAQGFAPPPTRAVSPPSSIARPNENNTTTIKNDNTFNINGGDINQVRRTVEDALNNKIEQASNNAQSPVAS